MPPNVITYRREIENNLRQHGLACLIPYIEDVERMKTELNNIFSNMKSDSIPVELDWLYNQYNNFNVKAITCIT